MTTQTAEQALTHHVRLVLMNDQPIYQEALETVRDAIVASRRELLHLQVTLGVDYTDAQNRFAENRRAGYALREMVEAMTIADDVDGMTREILTTALAFVDWDDLADDFREDDQDHDMFDDPEDPFLDDKIDRLKEARREGH